MKLLIKFLVGLTALLAVNSLSASTFVSFNENKPNVFVDSSHNVVGFDVDLIHAILGTNDISFSNSPTLPEFFKNVTNQNTIGIGGISVTSAREKNMDFVPYMENGLGIVTTEKGKEIGLITQLFEFNYFKQLYHTFLRRDVIEMFFSLALLSIIFAHIIWICEQGSPDIPDKYFPGIARSLYFCIVTKSTVGYGDVTVHRFLSRILVILMIIFGISAFGNFSGMMAATFVQKQQQFAINTLTDLKGKKIAVQMGSIYEPIASDYSKNIETFDTVEECIACLKTGNCDAVLADSVSLKYLTKNDDIVHLVPTIFKKHQYGFVFKTNDSRQELFREKLLKLKESGEYDSIYKKWFN